MLTIIDENSPWTQIEYDNYRTFLELRKERDKFLKSLTKVRYCDYIVDRKLVEAGGVGKAVYIYPARGSGRNTSINRVVELIESGRDVKFVRASDICTKPNRSYGPYDSDLWDHLDYAVTQKLIYQSITKDTSIKFKVLKNDRLYDNPFLTYWYRYGAVLNDWAMIERF